MSKQPQVPHANRSPKGPGGDGRKPKDNTQQKRGQNIDQQGDRANVKQNKLPQARLSGR